MNAVETSSILLVYSFSQKFIFKAMLTSLISRSEFFLCTPFAYGMGYDECLAYFSVYDLSTQKRNKSL